MAIVSALIKRLFGVSTFYRTNPLVSTVGTSVSRICKGDPNRVSLWISNNSANSLYIGPWNDVSSSKGFYVQPNGGNAIMQMNDDFHLPTLEWYAVAGAASSAITVIELISR